MPGPDLPSPLPRRTWSLFQREGGRPCGEQLPAILTWGLGASLQDKSQRPWSPARWLLSCPQPRPIGEAGAPRRMGKRILPPVCARRWALFTHDADSLRAREAEAARRVAWRAAAGPGESALLPTAAGLAPNAVRSQRLWLPPSFSHFQRLEAWTRPAPTLKEEVSASPWRRATQADSSEEGGQRIQIQAEGQGHTQFLENDCSAKWQKELLLYQLDRHPVHGLRPSQEGEGTTGNPVSSQEEGGGGH